MNLKETNEMMAFRKNVREWVLANMPKGGNRVYNYTGMEGDEELLGPWYAKLAEKNWLAFRWPKEYGGPGFTPVEQIVFVDELSNCGAPVPGGFGLTMVGPLIYQFGTDEQKKTFLPKIADNTQQWCQGYSEPGSGSDLASLQTKAVKEGDQYTVNGQKTWTSRANLAHWIFALVRTDSSVQKQKGISFLLIDMKTPGVSIRPIKQIDGKQAFYETFFDNVKVPAENLVGTENEGWTMAKALLAHERVGSGSGGETMRHVEKVKRIAQQYMVNGKPVLAENSFRNKMVQAEMDADCIQYTRYRMLTALLQGKAPGPESSIFKMFSSELAQRLNDLGMDAMGPDGIAWYDERLSEDAYDLPMFMHITRAASIYSGSNEVQRNIISKRVLGLPGS